MISDIKPSTMRVGFSKTRALSGKLWVDYLAVSKKWDLSFEMLTQAERDTLYNIFIANNVLTFVDENNQTHSVIITSENFDDNISYTSNGVLYYSINMTIEQV